MKKITLFLSLTIYLLPFSITAQQSSEPYYEQQNYLSEIGYYPYTITQRGSGIVVAVIDEGVWHSHPDIAGNMWNNANEIKNNGIDDDGNGYVDDFYGWNFVDDNLDVSAKGNHGTGVAGIIASRENNSGIWGIAPLAKIMALTACDRNGCNIEDVVKAIYYAVDNGADIINLSLGGNGYVGYSTTFNNALQYAYDNDVVIVASAGNGDTEAANSIGLNLNYVPVSPVCNDVNGYNIVLGVGANNATLPATWSNYGTCVDTYAPGVNILTTTVPQYSDNYYWSYLTGTSFSAPMVAGAVALLKNKYPELKNFELMDSITTLSRNGALYIEDLLKNSLPNPKISHISKSVVQAGDKIEITGEHFRSNWQLQLIGSNINMKISSQSLKFNDSNSLTLTIPSNTPQGIYKVKYEYSDYSSPSFEIKSVATGNISSESNVNINGATDLKSDSSDSGSDISSLGGRYDDRLHDQSLINRLKGSILLQVEEHGEAWYVNPTDGVRYYMKNGDVAYEMMRSFGLGITDADLSLIPQVKDTGAMKSSTSICSLNTLANRLKGRILLEVQQHGEAWYIHPEKCRRIYMRDGLAAYTIMRFLGLGITNYDLVKMPMAEVDL